MLPQNLKGLHTLQASTDKLSLVVGSTLLQTSSSQITDWYGENLYSKAQAERLQTSERKTGCGTKEMGKLRVVGSPHKSRERS